MEMFNIVIYLNVPSNLARSVFTFHAGTPLADDSLPTSSYHAKRFDVNERQLETMHTKQFVTPVV